MSEWQPIETAPRETDEDDFLLLLFWNGEVFIDCLREDGRTYEMGLFPTHWMPLPGPPKGGTDV